MTESESGAPAVKIAPLVSMSAPETMERGQPKARILKTILSEDTGRRHMLEFDDDRPSILDRRTSTNIPPTVTGYAQSRRWLRWAIPISILVPALVALAIA